MRAASARGVGPAARRPRPRSLGILAPLLVVRGDIISSIVNGIIGVFQSIWNGISNFFGTIFQAIANAFAAVFQAPVNAVESSWAAFSAWVSGFGPIAPLLTILVLLAVFLVTAWAIWLIIKLSVGETEDVAEEAEEGT